MGDKVKVSREVADVLDRIRDDKWLKRYHITMKSHAYSGNGVKIKSIYNNEYAALESLDPLELAECLILGYEVDDNGGE